MNSRLMENLRQWLPGLLVSLLLLTGNLGTPAFAGETGALSLQNLPANQETREKLNLAIANEKFLEGVRARAEQARIDQLFRQKVLDYPVEEKMAAVAEVMQKARVQGVKLDELMAPLKSKIQSRLAGAQGAISGAVTVEGEVSFESIEVVVFTTRGFFAARTDVSGGAYTIGDLPPGDYYVVTSSPFVDEFYNDVPLNGFRSWRDADLVTVTDGGAATDIDFDLQSGALVSGRVFMADGVTPLPFTTVEMRVFEVNQPGPQRRHEVMVVTEADGSYEINIPSTGSFKIGAFAGGFVPEFYEEKSDLASADAIQITSFDDEISDIDFSLDFIDDGSEEGSVISGVVTGPGEAPLPISFVFAFDASDTTIAGFGATGFSGEPYEIIGLDAGSYILYADNFLSFLFGAPVVDGEYYEDAQTSADATPVPVAEMDSVEINFELDAGGAIAGTITDDTGAGLDSVIVLAVKLDLDNIDDGNLDPTDFIDNIDIGFTFSDATGAYTVAGLSSGDYVVRTVSLLSTTEQPVVDEYYDNVQSIFDFQDATPVPVTEGATASGINFELDRGGLIAGSVVEASDPAMPVQGNAIVIAFEADRELPVLAIPEFDSESGEYVIGPLASGNYKLFGAVFPDDENGAPLSEQVIYVPQFYDGKATLGTADEVTVTAPDVTAGIDFKMVRTGRISGVVNIAPDFPVGADSLSETAVIVFNANTGAVAGGADARFAGGFSVLGLPPGEYKVAALPLAPGFSVTYHGGGTSFDHANSEVVTVSPGGTINADIDLVSDANGLISGTVSTVDGTPLDNVLVLAYDGTGHIVSAGVSGTVDLAGSQGLGTAFSGAASAAAPGEYVIPGLAAGDYFVRTFALSQILFLLEQLELEAELGGDPLTVIFGLLAGDGDDLFGQLDLELYADAYYPNTIIVPSVDDAGNIDLFGLLITLLVSDGDPGALIPFADRVPDEAGAVSVTSSSAQTDIDFRLPRLQEVITSVDEPAGPAVLPTAFNLSQNYPNPFNPSTVINYEVPRSANVSLKVFNMLGQQVKTLHSGVQAAGQYTVQWDGSNDRGEQVAAGIYFLRLKSDNNVALTRKMLFVK